MQPSVWQVSGDGDPPQVGGVAVEYAPGPGAAKLGGTVTINVTATDASGIASIVADTTGLADAASTRFTHVLGTDAWVATIPVAADESDGTRHVSLELTDRAGNVARSGADIIVDNLAPRIQGEARVLDIGQTKARLTLDASEPVTLVVTATSKNSPTVTAATTTLQTHPILEVAGLLPSREYAVQVRVLAGVVLIQRDRLALVELPGVVHRHRPSRCWLGDDLTPSNGITREPG